MITITIISVNIKKKNHKKRDKKLEHASKINSDDGHDKNQSDNEHENINSNEDDPTKTQASTTSNDEHLFQNPPGDYQLNPQPLSPSDSEEEQQGNKNNNMSTIDEDHAVNNITLNVNTNANTNNNNLSPQDDGKSRNLLRFGSVAQWSNDKLNEQMDDMQKAYLQMHVDQQRQLGPQIPPYSYNNQQQNYNLYPNNSSPMFLNPDNKNNTMN